MIRKTGPILLILLAFPAACSAQVVQLHTSTGKGTAVCVGETENGDQLFVTVRHNFEDGADGRVIFRNRAYAIDNVEISDEPGTQNDVACFTSAAPTSSLPIYRGSLQSGVELELLGFGAYYDGRSTTGVVRRARLDQLTWVINTDQQVIPGDSGGPVVYQNQTVGLVRAYDDASPMETQIVPAVNVERFLKKCQWQCGPGGCYIRQRVRQPIAGIAIPIGPPQIETEVIPRPRPVPEPQTVQGPRGERGPQGPQGPPGKDGAGPDPEYVQQIVISWLEANREQLKGDAGDTAELEKRVKALETRPLKVIITEGGKLKDEENYLPGEPVVFDLARLRAK